MLCQLLASSNFEFYLEHEVLHFYVYEFIILLHRNYHRKTFFPPLRSE